MSVFYYIICSSTYIIVYLFAYKNWEAVAHKKQVPRDNCHGNKCHGNDCHGNTYGTVTIAMETNVTVTIAMETIIAVSIAMETIIAQTLSWMRSRLWHLKVSSTLIYCFNYS